MKNETVIRNVTLDDAKRISEIYKPYVNETAGSFEYDAHDEEEIKIHRHLGFKVVGTFTHCGIKFDRYYNMVWAKKLI